MKITDFINKYLQCNLVGSNLSSRVGKKVQVNRGPSKPKV